MFVIGISGGSGSGKSTFVSEVSGDFPGNHIAIIRQDSYYKDNSHVLPEYRSELNFDHPSAIDFSLLENHILKLKSGESIDQPVYSFLTCTRAEETIKINTKRLIFLEGILIFFSEALRKLMDIKVFIDADENERLKRIIFRDTLERGRDAVKVKERFEKTVQPMHVKFVKPTMRYADIIVPGGGNNTSAVKLIKSLLEQKFSVTEKSN